LVSGATRSNKDLAESLDQAVDPKDPLVNRLLRVMATQAMSNALYVSTGSIPQDQYYHYGTVKHTCINSYILHLGHLADAYSQSDLQ